MNDIPVLLFFILLDNNLIQSPIMGKTLEVDYNEITWVCFSDSCEDGISLFSNSLYLAKDLPFWSTQYWTMIILA